MTKEYLLQNSIIATILGALSAFLGGFDLILRLLSILVICDYITGIMASKCEDKPISSKVGFKGICQKTIIFMLVGVSYYIDLTIGTPIFRNMTIMFFVSNEGISLIENIKRMGVSSPDKLKSAFMLMKDATNIEQLKKYIAESEKQDNNENN